jgi:hypothetical protein
VKRGVFPRREKKIEDVKYTQVNLFTVWFTYTKTQQTLPIEHFLFDTVMILFTPDLDCYIAYSYTKKRSNIKCFANTLRTAITATRVMQVRKPGGYEGGDGLV